MAKKRKINMTLDTAAIAAPVDQLARALVLAEPDDPHALALIHTSFSDIGQWAADKGQDRLAAAIRATADLIERIILNEAGDPNAAMEVVGRMASLLQAITNNGQDPQTLNYPPELALEPAEPAPSADSVPAPASLDAMPELPAGLPPAIDQKLLSDFLGRQAVVIETIERELLAFEKKPSAEPLALIRRHLHTLKGEAALLGLADVERICHAAEDILEHKNPKLLADNLLLVTDWLSQAFKAYAGRGTNPRSPEGLLKRFAEQLAGEAAREAEAQKFEMPATMPLEGDVNLLGDFISEAREHLEAADVCLLNLETDSRDQENINALFRRFHTIKGVAGFLSLEEIRALAHEAENLLDRARKDEIMLVGGAIDVVFDSVDALKRLVGGVETSLTSGNPLLRDEALPPLLRRIQAAASGRAADALPAVSPERLGGRRLGEILVDTGVATPAGVTRALTEQMSTPEGPRLGELLVREGQASARDVAHALRAQRVANSTQAVEVKETVKVDAERLDALVETIGELVIAESMVSQSPEVREIASAPLLRHLNQLDKITRELQAMGTTLRMVPLRSTFQKMARLVRDVAKKSGKQVEFVMVGEDTELDKTVVDKIGDPLVHMIRNAVDHGLESDPAARVAVGKPATGTVELRAYHKGGNIYIEIQDDGKGLDRKAILAKAVERGLIREGDTLADREIFNLIFQPGFSTAQVITDVSGRGVGMDVVKRNIDALRGQIDITSEPGQGTVFSIKLPLTLAIIDGMVIRVGAERYIIPTLSIIRSIRPKVGDISTVLGRGEMLSVHGQMIPIFRLDRLFSVAGAEQDVSRAIVTIVEDEGRQIGLVTDELLGQQQIVIKSLGEGLRGIPGISGGAIMSDGQVGLILDIGGMVRLAHLREDMSAIAAPLEPALAR